MIPEAPARSGPSLTRIALAIALLLAVLAYFLPAMSSGLFWAPADEITYYFPVHVLVARAMRHGELPFWNPFNWGGAPLLATLQAGLFYPGNLAYLVLPPVAAQNATLILAYWVAGTGMFAFVRALGVGRFGAFLAALVFMLGGHLTEHVEHLTIVQIGGLMPWMLWAIERLASTARSRYAGAAALVLCAQVVAGHPQTVTYSCLLAGAYALWRAGGLARERRVGFLSQLGLAGLLGAGAAAVQLLPTLDFIPTTQRSHIDFATLSKGSMPIQAWPGFLFPSFYGSRLPSEWLPVRFWADYDWLLYLEGYTGLVSWVLALVAVLSWRVDRQARFWAVAAATTFLLAMGKHAPPFHVQAMLPLVKMMPYATRHFLEFCCAMAVLAGLGADRLERAPGPERRRLVAASVGGLAIAMLATLAGVWAYAPRFIAHTQALMPPGIDLAWSLSLARPNFWLPPLMLAIVALLLGLAPPTGRLLRGGLVALVLVDLLSFGYHQGLRFVCPYVPASLPIQDHIDWDRGRAVSMLALRYPNCYDCDILSQIQRYHYPNMASLEGLPTVNGYDAFINQRYGRLTGMDSQGVPGETPVPIWEPNAHLLDVMGLVTLRIEPGLAVKPEWAARLQPPRWQRRPDEAGLQVYTNQRALPHAWRVQTATRLDPEAVDRRLEGAADFDPRREALVEDGAAARFAPGPARAATVSLNRIHLETDGAGPGLVVVSEAYDAGWRAFGATGPLPVRRVDAVVMGVEVPGGHQAVELVYRPRLWEPSVAASLLSLVLLAGWMALAKRRGVA